MSRCFTTVRFLVRLHDVLQFVPCTIAVSNCGRVLSEVRDGSGKSANQGRGEQAKSLFSLGTRRFLLDCSLSVQSRARPLMHAHTLPYLHLTSTSQGIFRLTTCSHCILPRYGQPSCSITFHMTVSPSVPVVHPRVTVSTARSGWVSASTALRPSEYRYLHEK